MRLFLVLVCVISNISFFQCATIDLTTEELREDDVYLENDVNPRPCTDTDLSTWPSAFEECFITGKIAGAGWNLSNTVGRVLQHAGDCLNATKLSCRPNYSSFQDMMNKVINELKDYAASFRLEIDFQGEEAVKDFDCVENVLSIDTYANCFESLFDSISSHENFLRNVENAMSCTNEPNEICSNNTKASLNSMVKIILGMKQFAEEDFKEYLPNSSPSSPNQHHSTTKTPLPSTTKTPLPSTSISLPLPSILPPIPFSSSPPPPLPNPSSTTNASQPTTTALPPTKPWYNYVVGPFVSAWNWFTNLFG